MNWFSIDMPEASLTDGGYHRFCRAFQKAFIRAGAPPCLALFARRPMNTTVRRLYLSPESEHYVADLLRDHDARRCPPPDPVGVTLVYGVPDARNSLLAIDKEEAPLRRPTILPLVHAPPLASSG